MYIEEFDYLLPKEMIAQFPASARTSSRLLVFHKGTGIKEHRSFPDITKYLTKGDVLVLNDSRVFPAKLTGYKDTGGKVDILLTEKVSSDKWCCLTQDVRKTTGEIGIRIGPHQAILARENSSWTIRFLHDGNSDDIIASQGKMPLPPYIKRSNGDGAIDYDRYQTVYAEQNGSIAAPTAGFHFSQELLDLLENNGVEIVKITLHIGIGTFSLIRCHTVEEHSMHEERYELSVAARDTILKAKDEGKRIVACGTSAVRTLETIFSAGRGASLKGSTDLFIYPGYQFHIVNALITNFHLPRSTPLLLAAAFAGTQGLKKCYEEAVEHGYRFYSYGDAMLIQ